MGISSRLQRAWFHGGALSACLTPLALAYRAVMAVRRDIYKRGWRPSTQVDATVIVVGNVVAGGAGKTPVVLALVRHLRGRGLAVGVISRGYGRRGSEVREVFPTSDVRDVGDEPAMLQRATGVPVFVGRKRVDAALALMAAHPEIDVILSDDGLQHLALDRDLEICVFDNRGLGNGRLLPAGPLREPWPRRCDLVLHTGGKPAFEGYSARRALAEHAVRADGTRVALASLVGQPVGAVAAIATPEAFFDLLSARGLWLERVIALPDHADFKDWKRPDASRAPLLCTEKDAVKLWAIAPDALAVPLLFSPEPAFFEALDRQLAPKLSSRHGFQTA